MKTLSYFAGFSMLTGSMFLFGATYRIVILSIIGLMVFLALMVGFVLVLIMAGIPTEDNDD